MQIKKAATLAPVLYHDAKTGCAAPVLQSSAPTRFNVRQVEILAFVKRRSISYYFMWFFKILSAISA
ncbi:hypothetical protein [Pseudoalteromonas sp. BDTF-M6]|uniref:hypothetical protein n=1 Tax=Pseudoalteromonas sp. BDTF-M6 TaxID=2796132 RepID=UPI001BAE885B|nr:hypothetical protein [Pseudoalteromonas sp. BDTF-M6]MBS3797482.1 hypothetical protein [Pseudoalteromonas sp. BDTF-M6]